jgi:cytoskeleton protein RodZ
MDIDKNIDAKANMDASNIDEIGSLLRNARKNRNEDLSQVASTLRIRQVYLEAIENNQFNVLPGDIYVVGFIKSYATHLGLDSESIVERYKIEIGMAETSAELIFPSYVPENGIPGGAVLLLGLIIAIVGYSGWYFLSVRNTFTTNQVTSVPKPFTDLIKNEPEISEPSKTNKIVIQEKNSDKILLKKTDLTENKVVKELFNDDSNNKLDPEIKDTNPITNSQDLTKKTLTPNTNTLEIVKPKTPKQESSVLEGSPLDKSASRPAPTLPPGPIKELKLETTTAKKLDPSLNPNNKIDKSLDSLIISNSKPSVGAKTPPKTPSQPQPLRVNPSRIILEAIADSYIQVRDNNINQLLTTRLLKQGQRYAVPDRSGLTLITGNAGALKILVDGTQVPDIGPIGAIRRNVILDAMKLKDGLAVVE